MLTGHEMPWARAMISRARSADAMRSAVSATVAAALVPFPTARSARGVSRAPARCGWQVEYMTVIKINALAVPAEIGEEVARRFAPRLGAVDDQKGFEGFELLQPSDERTTWLAVTRWQDDTHSKFEARRSSPSFDHGHRFDGGDSRPPMSIQAELSSYTVAVTSKGWRELGRFQSERFRARWDRIVAQHEEFSDCRHCSIVVAVAAVLMKRRANQKAGELRNQAQEHRDEAKASQIAATRQETQANAMAAKAKDDLLLAEQQRSAAAVKREVAADLNVRADNIDPDVPNTRT